MLSSNNFGLMPTTLASAATSTKAHSPLSFLDFSRLSLKESPANLATHKKRKELAPTAPQTPFLTSLKEEIDIPTLWLPPTRAPLFRAKTPSTSHSLANILADDSDSDNELSSFSPAISTFFLPKGKRQKQQEMVTSSSEPEHHPFTFSP